MEERRLVYPQHGLERRHSSHGWRRRTYCREFYYYYYYLFRVKCLLLWAKVWDVGNSRQSRHARSSRLPVLRMAFSRLAGDHTLAVLHQRSVYVFLIFISILMLELCVVFCLQRAIFMGHGCTDSDAADRHRCVKSSYRYGPLWNLAYHDYQWQCFPIHAE